MENALYVCVTATEKCVTDKPYSLLVELHSVKRNVWVLNTIHRIVYVARLYQGLFSYAKYTLSEPKRA